MSQPAIAILSAIIAWWASTGLIIALCTLQARRVALLLAAASVVAAAALAGLVISARSPSAAASYCGFFCALSLWGWIEISFLTGYVTGPRREACPADARGWRRFRFALEALLWHELSIAGLSVLAVVLTFRAPNQTGTLAFLILGGMRLSAKLNIFLGVPNLTDEFLPARLAYLKSYFRKAEFNLLFPVSMFLSAIAALLLIQRPAVAGEGQSAGLVLLLALIGLAMLEHAFMMTPVEDGALWRWALPAPLPAVEHGRDGRLESSDEL